MVIGPLAAPHFPERIMNLIINPEFKNLYPPLIGRLREAVGAIDQSAIGSPQRDDISGGRR